MRASVVVRCLNEEAHVGRLLAGLLHQTQVPDEIIIVDSGSTDATLEIAARFPTTIVHIEPDDFSFGRALNLGCRAATGDYLVFVSAHVYPVHTTWLANLLRPFDNDRVALTYGRQVGNESTQYSEHRILSRWFPAQDDPRQLTPFCNNANAAIRRALWERWPYDEDLTGLEDMDWAKRALAAGLHLSYVAGAPVVHAHDESWSQLVNRYRREAIAHKRIYGDQRMSRSSAVGLAAANIAGDLAQAVREGCALRNARDIVAFRTAQFVGSYQGFAQAGPVHAALKRRFYYPASIAAPRDVAEDSSVIDYSALLAPTREPAPEDEAR